MKELKSYFGAITPLIIILYFRFTGTTLAEYKENFRLVEGEVQGPFVEINERFDLVLNDTLEEGNYAYMRFMDRLLENPDQSKERELYDKYKEIYDHVQRQLTKDFTLYSTDTVGHLTQSEWDSLKSVAEGPVYTLDTVLIAKLYFAPTDTNYFVTYPLRFNYNRRLSGNVYFMLQGHGDRFRITDLEQRDAWLEDDEYRLKERIGLSGKATFSSFSDYEEFLRYKAYLEKVFDGNRRISALRLNSKSKSALAYKLYDEDDDLIYEDEIAIEGLEYAKNPLGLLDIQAEEGDSRFILWYDNWFIKLLIVMQVLIFLAFISDLFDRRKESKRQVRS